MQIWTPSSTKLGQILLSTICDFFWSFANRLKGMVYMIVYSGRRRAKLPYWIWVSYNTYRCYWERTSNTIQVPILVLILWSETLLIQAKTVKLLRHFLVNKQSLTFFPCFFCRILEMSSIRSILHPKKIDLWANLKEGLASC
jgi:hypothetical protein